jgi:hypothetical protein
MHSPQELPEPQPSPDAESTLDGTPPAGADLPLAQDLEPRGEDRRTTPRRKKLMRVSIQQQPDEMPFRGWVVDRSLGGLRLEVDHEVPVGQVLKVRSFAAPADIPAVDVRVQSAHRTEEGCLHLGCAYVRTPNWEVRIQFD